MRAAGKHFENIGDNVDPDKISILCEKIPSVFLIQQGIADLFSFDQPQEKILFNKNLKNERDFNNYSSKRKQFSLDCDAVFCYYDGLI